MDAHMPGPISVKLLEFVEGRWAIQLGQKKFKKIFLKNFFFKNFFACNLTLMCVDSLGFEDCRLATHLLNYIN